MNGYGATAAGICLLLSLGACGGAGDQPTAATSQTPLVPTPSATPSPTPTVDPTAAAKAKVLADYKRFFAVYTKGLRDGGVSYPYEQVMLDPALAGTKRYVATLKGLQGARITGSTSLVTAEIIKSDLFGKQPTATVLACAVDNLTAVSNKGKVIAKPPGKVSRYDELRLVKGRWMVFSQEAGDPSFGCKG